MPGLEFNVTFDADVANAPTGFVQAFDDAIQFYEDTFSNPITINLDVSWGNIGSALGESDQIYSSYTYGEVRNALASEPASQTLTAALASLPEANPAGSAMIDVSNAEAQALGLLPAGYSDGSVTFSSSTGITFDFNPNDRAVSGECDFIGVAEHEIAEVMGRTATLSPDSGADAVSVLDLYRYSAPGVRALTPSDGAYFSVNGGDTVVNTFNGTGGGDLGDWSGNTNDAYNAFSGAGVENPVSAGDVEVMNALGYTLSAAVGNDFYASGTSAILWVNGTSDQLAVWEMNLGTAVAYTDAGSVSSGWQVAATGAFFGNGVADLLLENLSSGEAAIWTMDGASVVASDIFATFPSGWQIAGVGDFYGYGYADILWRNPTSGATAIWEMNGTTPIGYFTIGSAPSAWKVAGVADFTGTSDADILWQNSSTNQVAIWDMSGPNVLAYNTIGTAPSGWTIAGVGDFTGDGSVDILFQNMNTDQLAIWQTDGTSLTGSAVVANGVPFPSGWRIAAIGDYYSTGADDILWQNATTGQAALWQIDATSVVSTAILASGIPANWQPVHQPVLAA